MSVFAKTAIAAIGVNLIFGVNSLGAKTPFSGLSRAQVLEKTEEISESIWESMTLMYTRIDPSLKSLIPGKEWNDEDRKVAACVYDKAVESGQRDKYEKYLLNITKAAKITKNNPKVTLMTAHEIPELEKLGSANEILKYMNACGQIKLNSERMKKSGLMEKIQQALMQQ